MLTDLKLLLTRKYKYLLFDLDHTLWDFEKNSSETLVQLFYEFELDIKLGCGVDDFILVYKRNNYRLWKDYENDLIKKEELRWKRFFDALIEFGYSDKMLSVDLAETYLKICPTKPHLIDHSIKLLDYLHDNYDMSIITNGFEEVQHIKIKSAGLEKYFDHTITSEMVGKRKPHGAIFKHCMDKMGGERKNTIIIGDNFHSDIVGGKKFGIDQVYFNPNKNRHNQKPTYNIECLSELFDIL